MIVREIQLTCICGKKIQYISKNRHFQSKKHIDYFRKKNKDKNININDELQIYEIQLRRAIASTINNDSNIPPI